MATKIFATLSRGEIYVLRDKVFRNGVAVEVTAEEKAHLVKNAVDQVNADDEAEFRQKFIFSDAEQPVVAPRTRRRPEASPETDEV